MNTKRPSNETAFGNASSWRGSLPALVSGILTLGVAAYGSWLLPLGLPDQYARSLELAQAEYKEVLGQRMIADAEALNQVAGEIAVIHKRLIALEQGAPERYWELASFQRQHAARLRERLNDAASSFLEDDRAKLTAQADRYQSQAREMLNLLAAGDSPFQLKAYLQLCSDAYQRGLETFGVEGASEKADSLAGLLTNRSHVSNLSERELEEAQLLLVRLQFEAAWQVDPANSLNLDQPLLEDAWRTLQAFMASTADRSSERQLRWQATQRILNAFRTNPDRQLDFAASPPPISEANATLNMEGDGDRLDAMAHIELLAVRGAWSELGFFLAGGQGAPNLLILSSCGRTVCRLACSAKALNDPDFASGFDAGLELVYRAAPHVPEFADLIWDSAGQHAAHGPSEANPTERSQTVRAGSVSPAVVSAILAGNSSTLKHSVLAISMGMQDRPNVARSHLQLLLRAGGDLTIVSRAVLRQFQPAKSPSADLLKRLNQLQEIIVELDPGEGLNWFALANVQLASDRNKAGLLSLQKAAELLGEIPAIREMILQAKRKAG